MIIKEDLTGKLTFEQRLEVGEGPSHVEILEKRASGRGQAMFLRQVHAHHMQGASQLVWLGWSSRGRAVQDEVRGEREGPRRPR